MNIFKSYVSADGIIMDYFRFGQGSNTLVILPGLSIQSLMPLAETVAESYKMFENDYTVYLFDRRRNLPAHYSVYDIAEDTYKAMKSLGLFDISLFGASQGGMAAMVLLCRYPGLFRKAVIASSSPLINSENDAVLRRWIDLAVKKDREALALDFAKSIYPENVFTQYRDYFLGESASYTDEDLERFMILSEGTLGFYITGELPSVSCPVFAIGASDDGVLGRGKTEMIADLTGKTGGSCMFLYSGFGHACFDTAPDFKQKIFDFFAE